MPSGSTGPCDRPQYNHAVNGMSLRDWFAGQAMNGLITSGDVVYYDPALPKVAYQIADAMINARCNDE